MKSILFIGNSFTFFNDMPAMVQNICNFRHDQIHTAKLTYGGYYLDQYLQPRTDANDRLCSLLEGAGWDYVVLQEQSSCPAVETQRFFRASEELCARIRQIGAEPVFYETWAYRNSLGLRKKLLLSYEAFAEKQFAAYEQAAQDNHACCIPVGKCFDAAVHVGLYERLISANDDYHPTLAGSYLAAVCFSHFLCPNLTVEWAPDTLEPDFSKSLCQYAQSERF